MKHQTLYRGGDNKKEKLSKTDKVYLAVQEMKRKALALASKKATHA